MKGIIKGFGVLLDKRQKWKLCILFVMMLIGAGLETVGITLIIPLITAVMTPDLLETNEIIRSVCGFFGIRSSGGFIIFILAALILLYIVKNIYIYFEYSIQYRFVYGGRLRTQRKLVDAYLHRPYEYYLHASTGNIMQVVTSDVDLTFNLLISLLGIFTELILSAAFIVALLIVDPLMTVVMAFVFLAVMAVISRIVKPILKKAGTVYQHNSGRAYQSLLQSVSGIKDVKVGRKEDYFIKEHSHYAKEFTASLRKYNLLGQVPRLLIESVSVSSMLLVLLGMVLLGREVSSMVPQLSAFAMAAVRLLPSVNRLSTSYNSLSYLEPSLEKTLENLSAAEGWEEEAQGQGTRTKKTEAPSSLGAAEVRLSIGAIKEKIELSHVYYAYEKTDTLILADASMEIPAGKSVGIVGASGAGKTTLVDILLGLLRPGSGAVLADGVDIYGDYGGWLARVGYIPQTIFLLEGTIWANVAFGLEKEEVSMERVWRALEEARLADYVHGLPEGLDTEIGERGIRLSGGQRQRIGIARALYPDPEVLVFDEATSSLDNETESAIMESINSLHGKKTLVIIAHRLTTIKNCDFVYRVEDGKVFLDPDADGGSREGEKLQA